MELSFLFCIFVKIINMYIVTKQEMWLYLLQTGEITLSEYMEKVKKAIRR